MYPNHNLCLTIIRLKTQSVQFVSELGVGQNLEVYCLLSKKWVHATITDKHTDHNQLCVKFVNGQGQIQWYSCFSPQIAPIGFKYGYTPNMNKRNNVPCIVSIVDDELNKIAPNHLQSFAITRVLS